MCTQTQTQTHLFQIRKPTRTGPKSIPTVYFYFVLILHLLFLFLLFLLLLGLRLLTMSSLITPPPLHLNFILIVSVEHVSLSFSVSSQNRILKSHSFHKKTFKSKKFGVTSEIFLKTLSLKINRTSLNCIFNLVIHLVTASLTHIIPMTTALTRAGLETTSWHFTRL